MGEFEAIDRLVARLPGVAPAGEIWAGDDGAVLRPPAGFGVVLAIDPVVEGSHFDLSLTTLADAAWKAMARNVSDVAAMGGRPWRAVCSVVGPPSTDLDAIGSGLAEAAVAFGCPIVGGDLAGGPSVSITVAITGLVARPLLRSGARAGDAIFVTRPLGAGAAGLRLLRAGSSSDPCARWSARPVPSAVAGAVAAAAGASAAIDVSDGLAADLGHVADASGVGFSLDDVPVVDGATEAEALGGGDDYGLVVCTPDPDRLVAAFAAHGLPLPAGIGRCVADPSVRTLRGAALAVTGWQHTWP